MELIEWYLHTLGFFSELIIIGWIPALVMLMIPLFLLSIIVAIPIEIVKFVLGGKLESFKNKGIAIGYRIDNYIKEKILEER